MTIKNMTAILENLGIKIEIASWRNIVPNVWSVHVRDAASPMCFTNGKGATKDSALCSALGEYMERISCNYFYNDHFLGEEFHQQPLPVAGLGPRLLQLAGADPVGRPRSLAGTPRSISTKSAFS